MKRMHIRKILKEWVNREHTDYNYLKYTFTNTRISSTKMSKEFESLVDEVYKLIMKL